MPKRATFHTLLAIVGYALSPLSWWNDLVVNVPLAYIFALPFSLMDERLFPVSFILGYFLSNLIGFMLLHKGLAGVLRKSQPHFNLKQTLWVTIFYTLLLVVLVILGWLPSPQELLHTVKHD